MLGSRELKRDKNDSRWIARKFWRKKIVTCWRNCGWRCARFRIGLARCVCEYYKTQLQTFFCRFNDTDYDGANNSVSRCNLQLQADDKIFGSGGASVVVVVVVEGSVDVVVVTGGKAGQLLSFNAQKIIWTITHVHMISV